MNRWHFARDSILEEKVKPNRGYFTYDYARRLFPMMKKYKNAYKKLLSNPKKVSKEVQNDIEVFSCNLNGMHSIINFSKIWVMGNFNSLIYI